MLCQLQPWLCVAAVAGVAQGAGSGLLPLSLVHLGACSCWRRREPGSNAPGAVADIHLLDVGLAPWGAPVSQQAASVAVAPACAAAADMCVQAGGEAAVTSSGGGVAGVWQLRHARLPG